ncbi:MAG: hypothetical protein P4L46_05520 [Fimbriimonas sp.]|nr:hypothetical protein [Fimbriimonas sp.]
MLAVAGFILMTTARFRSNDVPYLHRVAHEVVDAALVPAGGKVENGGINSTGFPIRVPGGTQSYYPAFWVRDAAMMLGTDLVPAGEVEGWVRVIAATQPGEAGLDFTHGLHIPPYSIPDHVTLQGLACWFPGAYAEQGVGDFGYLPPADDAFYFVQMVDEVVRLTGKPDFLRAEVKTAWGVHPVFDVCLRAFDSVESDPATGLVVCSEVAGKGRVDWGFCDSIVKTGSCLMPSLLRWQAASRLRRLAEMVGRRDDAERMSLTAALIRRSLPATFYRQVGRDAGMLLSATGLGHKDDVWASAFAVWLHILPSKLEVSVARGLLSLARDGGIVREGQVRHIPLSGPFGGHWERAKSSPESYQNGGYWATPSGWLIMALRKVDRRESDRLLSEFMACLSAKRAGGAPYEWIHPETGQYVNPNYGSSAGLVYSALTTGR